LIVVYHVRLAVQGGRSVENIHPWLNKEVYSKPTPKPGQRSK